MNALAKLYSRFRLIDQAEIFSWPVQDHGMAGSLDRYVANRLPAALQGLAEQLDKVSVLGVYPTHLETVAEELHLPPLVRLAVAAKPPGRRNRVRPWFFLADQGSRLIVAVPPGLGYLKHYTALLRHLFADRAVNLEIETRYYPDAAEAIATWTGLADIVLEVDSTVILGHVDEFARAIPIRQTLVTLQDRNAYFEHTSFQTSSGRSIHLLSFAFSFWADIAGHLSSALYDAGASEIIYLGKVGTLDSGLELYRDLIIPDSFMLAEHDRITQAPFRVPNGLAQAKAIGGLHVSTPTVMEQSHLQRQTLEALSPRSIDNEISYMALSAAAHNAAHQGEVRFSSLSFATDYVRRSSEHDLPAIFDLANNRTMAARALRRRAMAQASGILYEYLSGE